MILGIGGNLGFLGVIGYKVVIIEMKLCGVKMKSLMLNFLFFGNFNLNFKLNCIKFDWLFLDNN